MSIVAFCSAKGAPGVTTLSCLVGAAWPDGRRVLVAECDPSGGDLAARFSLGARPGMTSLALALRRAGGAAGLVDRHVQRLPGGLEVLVGPPGAEAAATIDSELGQVAATLADHEADFVVDCGRLVPSATGQSELLRQARIVVLVLRPDVAAAAHGRAASARLLGSGADAQIPGAHVASAGVGAHLVVAGSGKADAREIASVIGLPLLACVPADPAAAAVACGEPGSARRFERSALVSSARDLASRIAAELSSARASIQAGSRSLGEGGTGTGSGTGTGTGTGSGTGTGTGSGTGSGAVRSVREQVIA